MAGKLWLAGMSADETSARKPRFIAARRRELVAAVREETEAQKQAGSMDAAAIAASHSERMAAASGCSISVPKEELRPVSKESLRALPPAS